MRAVIDTNIFISSFFGGKPKKVIDLWKKCEVELCLSKEIFDEYVEVVNRFGLWHEKELRELMVVFSKGFNMMWVFNPPRLTVEIEDPDDVKFIECAVAGKCDYIVTGDAALKTLAHYGRVKILPPAEFFSLFSE